MPSRGRQRAGSQLEGAATLAVSEGGGLEIFSFTAVRNKFHKGLRHIGILSDPGPGAADTSSLSCPRRSRPRAALGLGRGGAGLRWEYQRCKEEGTRERKVGEGPHAGIVGRGGVTGQRAGAGPRSSVHPAPSLTRFSKDRAGAVRGST